MRISHSRHHVEESEVNGKHAPSSGNGCSVLRALFGIMARLIDCRRSGSLNGSCISGLGGAVAVGFINLVFDLFISAKCLRCDSNLSPPDPDGCYRIPHGWPAETIEFLGADFSIDILGKIPIPARILCSGCWLDLEPASAAVTLSVGERKEQTDRTHVQLITPFYTNDTLLEVIHFLKFSSGRTSAPPLSWWLALSLSRHVEKHRPGGFIRPLVIPVPLHPSRRRSRGYNQAADLAKYTAGRAGIDMSRTVLRRIRKTKPQANLEPEERAENVRGAFELVDLGIVRGRDVIVIDDLVTTGETARASIAALGRGRPASITVLAAGRPKRFGI